MNPLASRSQPMTLSGRRCASIHPISTDARTITAKAMSSTSGVESRPLTFSIHAMAGMQATITSATAPASTWRGLMRP
jgi:hypothetical protein